MDGSPVDRESIRAELAATRITFTNLVESLSAEDWDRPTSNPSWTVGNLLHHIVSSLELVPLEVEHARQGKGLYNLPRFVRDPLSAWLTRWETRHESLGTVAARYEKAYEAALGTLDQVREDEWRLGAEFWGEGFLDIEGLLRSQARHFAEHSSDIAAGLSRESRDTSSPDNTRGPLSVQFAAHHRIGWARRLLAILSITFMLGAFGQFLLVGLSVFDDSSRWSDHQALGHALGALTWVMWIPAIVGRTGRRLIGSTILLLILFEAQYIFINAGSTLVNALHPLNGSVLLVLSTWISRQAIISLRQSAGQADATIGATVAAHHDDTMPMALPEAS